MNKVLIILYVPLIEMEYEIYIPINKKVGTIKKILIDSIIELSDGALTNTENLKLYDNNTGDVISNNAYVKNSNIKTGTKLVLI